MCSCIGYYAPARIGKGAVIVAFVCPSRTYQITQEHEGLACPNSE